MGRPWKGSGLRPALSLQEFSIYPTNNGDESDQPLGIESGLFQTKHSSFHLERKKLLKEKVQPLTVSPCGRWIKLGLGFLLLLVFLVIVYLGSGWKRISGAHKLSHFSIIFDCGSTGTRVHVYKWSDNKDQEKFPVLIHTRSEESTEFSGQQNSHAWSLQTEPGLDKYLYNESGLRASIEPLLQWAEQQVPSYAHRETPVFLLATAGLRRLPASDANWILDKIRAILLTTPFTCQRSQVRVISGVEEAYYGWVALNYEMNTLHNVSKHATFGAIDLGGSSVEVTFETGKENKGEYAVKLNIGSMEHHLYAYSLPAYGLNDAFEKSVILLSKKFSERNSSEIFSANYHLELKHPCLQASYRKPYYCSKCHPLLSAGSLHNRVISMELVGDPNWVECEALAKSTVNVSLWSVSAVGTNCDQFPCALHKHQPQPHGSFYALSGFFFVYNFFNLTSTAHYNEILEKGQHFCSQTWQDSERDVVQQPFVERYCFGAPYVVALLRDGLHLRDEQVIIGSERLTWTLGAALLDAVNLLSSTEGLENQHQPIPILITIGNYNLDLFTCTIMLFIFLMFGSFIVTCICKFHIWFGTKHHLPLFQPKAGNYSGAIKVPSS